MDDVESPRKRTLGFRLQTVAHDGEVTSGNTILHCAVITAAENSGCPALQCMEQSLRSHIPVLPFLVNGQPILATVR
jgi:hypothetical protein